MNFIDPTGHKPKATEGDGKACNGASCISDPGIRRFYSQLNATWGIAMAQWATPTWNAAKKDAVDEYLVAAVIFQETWPHGDERSNNGAGMGLMQIEFKEHLVDIPGDTYEDKLRNVMDPAINIDLGVRYLNGRINDFAARKAHKDPYIDDPTKWAIQSYNYGPTGGYDWVVDLMKQRYSYDQALEIIHNNQNGHYAPAGQTFGNNRYYSLVFGWMQTLQSH